MSFLESQLERVTASCQTVESYNSRIDSIQDAMAATETRVANNTRLIKIAQSFGEQVEDDMKKFKHVYSTKFQVFGSPSALASPPCCFRSPCRESDTSQISSVTLSLQRTPPVHQTHTAARREREQCARHSPEDAGPRGGSGANRGQDR